MSIDVQMPMVKFTKVINLMPIARAGLNWQPLTTSNGLSAQPPCLERALKSMNMLQHLAKWQSAE